MEKMNVQETANARGVTRQAVYGWMKDGLKHEKVKEIGKKEYAVIDPDDVDDFLKLTK